MLSESKYNVVIADVDSGVEKVEDYRYTSQWNLKNVTQNYCSKRYLQGEP